MKTYEKPVITVVTLTANSAFCSCAADVGDIINQFPNFFTVATHCEFDETNSDVYCKMGPTGETAFAS